VSCSPSVEVIPEYMDEKSGTLDYSGMEFKYLTEELEAFIGVKQGTFLYDCAMQRIKDIENEFGCKLNVEHSPTTSSHYESCRAIIMSGLTPADIMDFRSSNTTASLAYAGLLYPLTEVHDIIHYEDSFKYGAASVLECAMLNGVPYAVQPASWPGFPDAQCFLLTYNVDKVSSKGLPDLHEYYENATWTWSNFEYILDQYTSKEAGDPYVALATHAKALVNMSLFSNGVKFADYIDGTLQSDLYQPKVVNAITWLQNLYSQYRKSILDIEYWSLSEFIHGQALMTFVSGAQAYNSDIQYNCDFTFGLMPFPCGPDAVYGEWANWREELYGVCMPVNVAEPEAVARIISALCEPFEEFGTNPEELKDYYANNVFSLPVDAEIYFDVGKYGRYIYWQVGGLDFTTGIINNYSKNTAQQLVEAYASSMDEVIDKYIKPNFENYMFEVLYGGKG
jgi:hypothetical protein